MEDIKCIFCKKSSNQIVIEENEFKGRKCPWCGLIFISPRPSYSETLKLYTSDHTHKYAESHIGFKKSKTIHAKHTLAIIKRFKERESILELGAGAGYFLLEAKKEGFEVFSIEPDKIQASFINNTLEIPCEVVPLNENSFDEKKFDIIYHHNVLSHFHDPINEFKKINNKLKNNGILVFETGNIADIKEKYYKYFAEFCYPEHLFFFGENTLKKLLEQTGFKFLNAHKYSIIFHLFTQKLLWSLKDSLKDKKELSESIENTVTGEPYFNRKKFSFKRLIRSLYRFFSYFLIYKVGFLIPKKGRPQTVIIVARKSQ